ncbi:hypothetical protein TrVE_jg8197 [Triparma verrucosa]|uniref:Uncharacterized protein n=1 Tax=Triparma verrucosa TaxID=1606542 RepID=A0A9W7F6F2_9STRA|nr:hypothetical protein TrVE_jg8197 [Triparma verrucosa]
MNAVKQEESNMIDIDVKVEYLMDVKREEGYFDESNEEEGGVGGDDVGGGGVVVKEEEVEEEEEEVVVGTKRKAEEEAKPRKTKKKGAGKCFVWTEEDDDALQKGAGKYGLDFERIRGDNGNILAERSLRAPYNRLYNNYPEKYRALRAANPRKKSPWTVEEDAALKRGVEELGANWEKILSENAVLKRRTVDALRARYYNHLNKK